MSADTGERPDVTGRVIAGRYRLVAPIGRGGMGAVWLAVDELLDREVAVKEVHFPGGLPDEDRAELAERSLREARAAARLRHPSVITVHDVVKDGGQPCIVMEFVPSRSLDEVVAADGRLPPRRVAEIGLAVLGALRTAHAAGVLHRDVKPSNVLLAADGRVVLTDFGIARLEGDSRLTMTGRIMGSAGFIAPELAQDQRSAGPAADLWSLGATLYCAVEGRPPYSGDNFLARLAAAATEDPEPMRYAGPLTAVIAGLMVRDPAERYDAGRVERMLAAVVGSAPGGSDSDATLPTGQPTPTEPLKATSPRAEPPQPPSPQPPSPQPPRSKPPARKRNRVVPLAVVAVLIAAGVSGVLLSGLGRSEDHSSARSSPPPASPTPSAPTPAQPTPTTTGGPSPVVTGKASATPPRRGFEVGTTPYRDDRRAFSVLVPEGWTRTVGPNYVIFTMPGSGSRSDFLVSWQEEPTGTPPSAQDPTKVLERAESEYVANSKPVSYERHRLAAVEASAGAAAEWEFSYLRFVDKDPGFRARVVERAVASETGDVYIMRWRIPEKQWQESQKLLRTLFSSFRPPAG